MREVSDADDADDADDDEDDERSRSRLMSPDSRPPEDVERLVAGLSAQLEDARDALEIAENELTCQICFEERRDAVLMPCMHMLYCVGCVDRVATEAMRSGQPDRCPCCRQSVCGVLRCKASARGG
jgi:alkylhydroperoxidase family enzyme